MAPIQRARIDLRAKRNTLSRSELRYDGQTVVITGAGSGLGKAYALLFASRGANVVVNDCGASLRGEGRNAKAADDVVSEIKAAGGAAVASYESVEQGEKIIAAALNTYGRIDVLINNAGCLRDVSFKNMTDRDWDMVLDVHVTGAYKCTRAAWPHFKRQKYGRIVNTSSAAGLFGSFGQSNYSAAKLALVGLTQTLAKEGIKYNILCNVIAPVAASRMTATVWPPEMLESLKPDWVAPLVAVLTHSSNAETGAIFEAGGGHIAKLRWERAKGLTLKPDDSYTPDAILKSWDAVSDFSQPEYPNGIADMMEKLEQAMKLKTNPQGEKLDFNGRVALVTGGGAGIGRALCLLFAKHGAKVVVNDLKDPEAVVKEIIALGGQAVPNKASVEDGDAVIKTAIEKFGRIDILVNNAGILRDVSFGNMKDEQWDTIMKVHLRGTYKCSRAAYPYMVRQRYGRIVNTTSTSGVYGSFGQANYAAAKLGILGFSRTLALEGVKYGVLVNTIAPSAGTQLTATVFTDELVQAFKPAYVAPLVVALCSDKVPKPATGALYEVGSGYQARTRWQRSGGHGFPIRTKLTPEAVAQHWEKIVDFEDGRADNPESNADGLKFIMGNVGIESVETKQQAKSKSGGSKL